ncbi:hypothetical protein [Leptospira meyeri]|uniref:hypothetical protein n=1 Tax=Leptospira meyeri TaxID=29508 RepID=UPI000C29E35C|nr:hypothetical protein [Leptospira meyeri]PJZ79257.1 hypothetical protein CH359_18975 [Leptospira meyeri]PJZ95091.1 hypothetical protein CH358_18935 [Leptospira meyeri]
MKFLKILSIFFLISTLNQCITYLKKDNPVYNPAKVEKKIGNIDFVLYYNHYNAVGERAAVSEAVHRANKQAFTDIIGGCNCISKFNIYVDGLDDISKLNSKNLVNIEVTSKVKPTSSLILTSTLFVITGGLFPVFGEINGKTEFVAFDQGKEIKRYTYENDVVEVRQILLLFVMPFRQRSYITNQNVPDNFVNDIYRDKLYP